MTKTMTRILLLAFALVLALSLTVHAEEEAVSTQAFLFWQDADWWPAATIKADDYWAPVPATVTGEGYYTVGVTAHMPSWFYSGGNHNQGAQKLAVVIQDGSVLFPGYYMQITDVRINGVSYPCGDVTYGQTGYENANSEDGSLFWDADDSYALLYDQWMIDNAGNIGNGGTWNSAGEAQKFDVFDVSVLNDPATIEIDFFLSSQQDVKPEGGPELRVIGQGPKLAQKIVPLSSTSDLQLDAWLSFMDGVDGSSDGDWWPQRTAIDQSGNGVDYLDDVITGEGEYTIGLDFASTGWHSEGATGILNAFIIIENGEAELPGSYVQITDVRYDGASVGFNNNLTVPFTWDTADQNDTAIPLYVSWMNDTDHNNWNRRDWSGEGTCKVLNPADVDKVGKIEIDFIITDAAGEQPEPPVLSYEYTWYPNNTMGVAGISLRDKGITDKWYNVVPVDLTENGIYEIPLIASNMYQIGTAIVTVEDGQATVTYKTVYASGGHLTMGDECVKWFGSIEEITDEFCDAPASEIAFGDTVDVSALGNVGYLFICNRVSYSQPITGNGAYLAGYYPKAQEWVDYRAALEALMAPTVEEVPAE